MVRGASGPSPRSRLASNKMLDSEVRKMSTDWAPRMRKPRPGVKGHLVRVWLGQSPHLETRVRRGTESYEIHCARYSNDRERDLCVADPLMLSTIFLVKYNSRRTLNARPTPLIHSKTPCNARASPTPPEEPKVNCSTKSHSTK